MSRVIGLEATHEGGGPGRRFWIGLAVLLGLAGCSDKSGAPPSLRVYEVRGQILKGDGKPLSGGHIYFVHKDGALTSEGTISSDGTFSLSTGNLGDGAPAGEYKVRVEPADPSQIADISPRRRTDAGKRLPFPRKYLDEDTSGLTSVVNAESNHLVPIRLR